MHSVCGQPDFVSTWLARSDAIFLEFEVADLQFQRGDVDYGVWTHTLQHGESTWPVVADPGQHDDIGDSPPHGQYGRVESHCSSCCPADEATPVREDILSASPRIVHNARLHKKDPAEAVAAFEFSETRCARRCSRTAISSGLCSMPQCKDAFKKVRFCPSVSFCSLRSISCSCPVNLRSRQLRSPFHLAYRKPVLTRPLMLTCIRSHAVPPASCSSSAIADCDAAVSSEISGAAVPVVEHSLLQGEPPNPFTSFDEVQGTRVLVGSADWPRYRYTDRALETSDLPGAPDGRVMLSELASFPSPQIAITQDRGPDLRRAVVVDAGLIGGQVETLDVFPGVTPVGIIRGLRSVAYPRVAEEQLASGHLLCLINQGGPWLITVLLSLQTLMSCSLWLFACLFLTS